MEVDYAVEDAKLLIVSEAIFDSESVRISEDAKMECEVERKIPIYCANYMHSFGYPVAIVDHNTLNGFDKRKLTVKIDRLVGDRGGHGFGGRFVVSEIGVVANLDDDENEFDCSAGLGVNPFGNFKACQRLDRCSKQIGGQLAKWAITY